MKDELIAAYNKIEALEKEREWWGNEFSAVCILKEQLEKCKAGLAEMMRANERLLSEVQTLKKHSAPDMSSLSFKEYWGRRRDQCPVWDQKSEELKHLHTWLNALCHADGGKDGK